MTALSTLSLAAWIEALAGPRPVPAGGALALATLAGASGLAAKVLGRRAPAPFDGLAREFLAAAEEDADGYRRAVRERGDALPECLEAGLRHVKAAAEFLEGLAGGFDGLPDALAADLAAARGLGRAAARALLVNLAVNLAEWSEEITDAGRVEALRQGLEEVRIRLEES